MGYTQDELDAAVARLVKTSIRRQYGALGTRRTDLTFSDVQDAAAGVFILYPNAPFYVVFLASNRLKEAVAAEQGNIDDFIAAVVATGRNVSPITSLSPLANARSALEAMAVAMGARSSTFTDITDIPAYQRFDRNTERFLDESGKNVRSGGGIVRTPDDARAQLAGMYTELMKSHVDIIRRVTGLAGAMEDFAALNLPGSFSSSVISNAQGVLSDHYNKLDAMGEKERLSSIRDTVLDILATRAVVKGFGSLASPTLFVPIKGSGSVFADAARPATPAALTSDNYGPYAILPENNELDFTLDSGDTTTIALQGSFVATAESTVMEPYDIGSPNSVGATNDHLRIEVENFPLGGSTVVDANLSAGATQAVTDVCQDINTSILGVLVPPPIIAEPYPFPLKFAGNVNTTHTFMGHYRLQSTNPLTDFTQLPIEANDLISITDPTSAIYGSILRVFSISSASLDVTFSYVVGVFAPETDKSIQVGGPRMPIRLRVTGPQDSGRPDYRLQALNDKLSIYFSDTGVEGKDVQFYAATTLGWVPVSDFVSRRTTAQEIVNTIRTSGGASLRGVARVDAQAQFVPTAFQGRCKTDPYNFMRLIASKFDQRDVIATSLGPTSYSFAATPSSDVVIGDKVVIRVSVTSSDIGAVGTITSVAPAIEATFLTPLTTLTGLGIEVGPDLSTLPIDATAVVYDGINAGSYSVVGVGTIPFELELGTRVPQPATVGNLSPTGMTMGVGFYKVVFQSLDETTATSIFLSSLVNPRSVVPVFFTPGLHMMKGTTAFIKLPEVPKSLEEDDIFELYTTRFDFPDLSMTIKSFDSAGVVELEGIYVIFTSQPDFTFDVSTIPFARIRRHKTNDYAVLKIGLDGWLRGTSQQVGYQRELTRLLSILKANTNPTPSQVNDVKLQLQLMLVDLGILESVLDLHTADVVDQVDALIAALMQEGADKAADVLLEARFSEFFGLDIDEVSYAGSVQKSMRETARLDMPVRRTGRTNRDNVGQAIIAQYEEPDYNYDKSDVDDVSEPDIPVGTTADL